MTDAISLTEDIPVKPVEQMEPATISEANDNDADDQVSEVDYSANGPDENFAYVPSGEPKSGRKLKIGDAVHAHEAVVAVANGAYRGEDLQIPESAMSGVKAKVAAAVRKFYSGDEQGRLLTWLHTGKKSEDKPVKEIRMSTPTFTFRGQFPDVPLAPGVDEGGLTEGDPGKPLYVVRPLAVLNAVSDNGLKYDEQLLQEIEQQVLLKKPAARQGHVSEESSGWEFPADVGLWVGAKRAGNTLFGKAYIYPGTAFHQMVVKRKAAGSTLSNSIWGKGHFEDNPDGTHSLRGLELESIDFAPEERAALEALGGQFETTSEMKKQGVKEMDSDEISKMSPHALHEMMTKDQRQHCAEMHIREMEPASVYEMLPLGHKQGIADCYAKEFGQQMGGFGAGGSAAIQEMTTLKTSVAEMQATIAEYRQREFDNVLDNAAAARFATWNVTRPEGKAAVTSAKNNFKMYIVAEMAALEGGQKIENILTATEAAWPKYEPQAALLKTALSGGNVIVGQSGMVSETANNSYGYDPKTGRYTDDAASKARGVVAPH